MPFENVAGPHATDVFSFLLFSTNFSCARASAEHTLAKGNLLFLEKASSLPEMSKDRLFSHLSTPTPLVFNNPPPPLYVFFFSRTRAKKQAIGNEVVPIRKKCLLAHFVKGLSRIGRWVNCRDLFSPSKPR